MGLPLVLSSSALPVEPVVPPVVEVDDVPLVELEVVELEVVEPEPLLEPDPLVELEPLVEPEALLALDVDDEPDEEPEPLEPDDVVAPLLEVALALVELLGPVVEVPLVGELEVVLVEPPAVAPSDVDDPPVPIGLAPPQATSVVIDIVARSARMVRTIVIAGRSFDVAPWSCRPAPSELPWGASECGHPTLPPDADR